MYDDNDDDEYIHFTFLTFNVRRLLALFRIEIDHGVGIFDVVVLLSYV